MTSWPQNAIVGQRVVCISTFEPRPHIPILPQKGIIYTIRRIRPGKSPSNNKPGVYLMFQEFTNAHVTSESDGRTDEPAFDANEFRPVDETKIDVFRRIAANPPKVLIDA